MYTVIGIYGDNNQPWIEFADGANPMDAARNAILAWMKEQDSDEEPDILIVDVIKGRHPGVLNNEYVVPARALFANERKRWRPK